MDKEIEEFYNCLKELYTEVIKTRNKTISTREFKEKTTQTYEKWKTEIKPKLATLQVDGETLEALDAFLEDVYNRTRMRTADVFVLKEVLEDLNGLFLKDIISPLEKRTPEPHLDLMKSASFLGLDTNWSSAMCALQLQEIAIILVAKRLKIDLCKTNVEKILDAKIESKEFSFNHQYEAFRIEVKRLFSVDMPFLTTQFRKMRVKVLHEGYNPQPEEKDSIVSFTIGLLQKLNSIGNAENCNRE